MSAVRAFAPLVAADGERIFFDADLNMSAAIAERIVAARVARVPTIRAFTITRTPVNPRNKPVADIETVICFVGPAGDMARGWRA